MIVIGYSGHAFVTIGILNAAGKKVTGYCEREEKSFNPFSLQYFGSENGEKAISAFKENDFFISIGDNHIREKIFDQLAMQGLLPVNAVHPSAVIDPTATIETSGVCSNSLTAMCWARSSRNQFNNVASGVILTRTGTVLIKSPIIALAPSWAQCLQALVAPKTTSS